MDGGGQFETLFKQGGIIMGSPGMYVVDASDEFNPQFLSAFTRHFLRSGSGGRNYRICYPTWWNYLQCQYSRSDNVIDITDMAHPSLISTYLMNQPMDGVRNNAIYVCSGNGGGLNALMQATTLHCLKIHIRDVTDVIALDSHLIAVGKNKIIQYSYGDNFTLLPISTLNF